MFLDGVQSDNINDTVNLFANFFHSSFSETGIVSELLPTTHCKKLEIAFSDEDIINILSPRRLISSVMGFY